MINTVAVSFSAYDENGVIMLNDVVALKDFVEYFKEGIKRTPYEQAQRLLKGYVLVREIQKIRDSVVTGDVFPPTDATRNIYISDIVSCSSDETPDSFLTTCLWIDGESPVDLKDWEER